MKPSNLDEAQKLLDRRNSLKRIIADEQRYHSILELELKCSTGEAVGETIVKALGNERTTIINTIFEEIRAEYKKVLDRLREIGVEV